MNSLSSYLLVSILFLSKVCLSQLSSDSLALSQTDIKDISGSNTVSITSYDKGGNHYVYVGGFGNVDVFSLNVQGELTPVSNHELYKKKGPARGMVADRIGINDFLFVANKHGNAIEVFEILSDGSLNRAFMVEDTDETYISTAITLQVVHMKNTSYLFAGGLEESPGLSCFKIHNDGKLTHVQSIKDDEEIHTDGIIGMYVHKIGGKTFLYTGGFQDNGVSGFRIYNDGTFKNITNISDNTVDRFLTGAYPVTGVKLGNNYYIVVGHRHHKYYKRKDFIKKKDFVYHGDAVSVFKVNKKGELIPHTVLKNDETTMLEGQTRIEIVEENNNEAILAVGTRDNAAIQLCKLNEQGELSPIGNLEIGFSIYYGLRSHKINSSYFLIAGSNQFDFRKVVVYKVVF